MTPLLRLEGACYAIAATLIYWQQGFSWWLFTWMSLVPDLSMIGYLAGRRVGAICYNCAHTTLLPWALLLSGYFSGNSLALAVALI